MQDTVTVAVIAGSVSLITALVTASISFTVAERKLRRDLKLEFAAEKVALDLMKTEWPLRSFDLIRTHLGGFSDDDLRKVLVRAGAIRFSSKSGIELWGLLERNRNLLGVYRVPWDPENRPTEWPEWSVAAESPYQTSWRGGKT